MSPALRGALWMGLTVLSFVAMAVSGRELAGTMSPFETVALRSLVGITVLTPIAVHMGFRILYTQRITHHIARNAVHFVGQVSWFYALGVLALAMVTAIEFTMSLWAILLAALFIGERIDGTRWVTVAFGFAGVLAILRPGVETVSFGALIMLMGSLFYGGSIVMVKSLTRTESAFAVVFYMNVCQFLLGLAVSVFDWTWPGWAQWPWLVGVGLSGLCAHYTFTRALALAEVSVVSPIDFLRLPTTALVGYVLYRESVDVWVWIGAAMVFGANYYNVWRASKARR
jgi:drug/metabolite transporter (DMT)-like permease